MKNPIVILDNGHGEETPGKRSPIWENGTQLFEWEFNRDIVRRISAKLDDLGIPFYLLVPEKEDIVLGERVRRVNAISQKEGGNVFLVSVHANAGGGVGWEAFTSIGQTTSDQMAEVFYKKAHEVLQGRPIRTCNADGDSDKESRFYILRKTVCPAVLTENLFMDTESDCNFIMSEEGRNEIARLHVEAIEQIYNS